MYRVAPVVAALLLVSAAQAGRHALLIGVPSTPHFPEVKSLEGPVNDVAALREALIADWGFAAADIASLVGADASRAAILDALDRLAQTARAGDQVFVYFSGHGVSAHDRKTRGGFGLDRGTGALVPADLRKGSNQEIVARLIVAKRDLRPHFERLDRSGAEIFVVFDACFSGDTYKSPSGLVPRNADLPGLRGELAGLDLNSMEADEPYERLVYLSASARDEVAYDTPQEQARQGGLWPTLDGQAHGAFTNELLLALRGDGDRDGDGRIEYEELYWYLRERLERRGQTPSLHPRNKPMVKKPVLGQGSGGQGPRPASPSSDILRVRISPANRERAAELAAELAADERFDVTDGAFDLEVRVGATGDPEPFRVLLPSGVERLTSTARSEVVELLQRHAIAKRIWGLAYPAQDRRVQIELNPDWPTYLEGDSFSVVLRASQPSWLLLLAIDNHGGIVVLHPYQAQDMRQAAADTTVLVAEVGVSPPYGEDQLVAFAFRDRPAGYGDWVGHGTEPLDGPATEKLIQMLQADASEPGRARTHRIIHTKRR